MVHQHQMHFESFKSMIFSFVTSCIFLRVSPQGLISAWWLPFVGGHPRVALCRSAPPCGSPEATTKYKHVDSHVANLFD